MWRDEPTNAVAVVRGPLVFALPLEEAARTLKTWQPFNNTDFELSTSSTWNVALVLDAAQPNRTLQYTEYEYGEPALPFDAVGCPLAVLADVRVVPAWSLDAVPLTAAEPPPSPVLCGGGGGPSRRVRLTPYGATNLRIAGLPWTHLAGE